MVDLVTEMMEKIKADRETPKLETAPLKTQRKGSKFTKNHGQKHDQKRNKQVRRSRKANR